MGQFFRVFILPPGQLSDFFFHTWLTLGTSPGCACTLQPRQMWKWRLLGGTRLSTFIVVQLLIRVQLFATPWTAESQGSLSFTISWILTGGCWNSLKEKKDTPCHRTREMPQGDVRRGTITLKSNPIPTRWPIMEKNNAREVLTFLWSSRPHIRLPNLGIWQRDWASPGNLTLKVNGIWL